MCTDESSHGLSRLCRRGVGLLVVLGRSGLGWLAFVRSTLPPDSSDARRRRSASGALNTCGLPLCGLDFLYCIRRFASEPPRTGLLSSVVPYSPRRPHFAIMTPSGQGHETANNVEPAPRPVLVARGFERQLRVASSARAVRCLTSHSSTQFVANPTQS